jgi:hypothetical protein
MYLQIAELGKRFSALFTGVLHYLVVYLFPVPASCVITNRVKIQRRWKSVAKKEEKEKRKTTNV